MRVARLNEAKEGRGGRLAHAFRELLTARMLWVSSSVAVVGIAAGLIFMGGDSGQPLQILPEQPGQTAVKPPKADATAQVTSEQPTVQVQSNQPVQGSEIPPVQPQSQETPAVASETSCQPELTQIQQIRDRAIEAENNSFEKQMRRRNGAKQLLSALTGGLIGPPSEKEIEKHNAKITAINQAYEHSVASLGCD